MPNPISDRMEKMSIAYVSALCAANGYTFTIMSSDYDGVDCVINCPGYPCDDCGCIDQSSMLSVQLKSTYSSNEYHIAEDGSIHYNLKVQNYNKLVVPNRATPTILILFIMPEDANEWLDHTIDYLKIRKCAYWLSLSGRDPSTHSTTVTISIPSSNALSAEELQRIMIKVSKEESL